MADYTPESWARALLHALGAPSSPSNIEAIVAWEQAEGGHWHNSDRFNPLNTTQAMPGAQSTNADGVKRYVSWEQGLEATVKTLRNGMYSGILHALSEGKNADSVKNAIVSSPWGTKQIGKAKKGDLGPLVPKIPGLPDLPSPGDLAKPFTELADAFESFGKIMGALLLPSTWIRIAAGGMGVMFLMFALLLIGLSAKKGHA